MAAYVLAPLERPTWSLEPGEFASQIQARWPEARAAVETDRAAPMAMHALIPFAGGPDGGRRELGIAMTWTGDYVSLDPADPDAAAEFAVWLIQLLPEGEPRLHMMPKDRWAPMPLDRNTAQRAIADHLVGAS